MEICRCVSFPFAIFGVRAVKENCKAKSVWVAIIIIDKDQYVYTIRHPQNLERNNFISIFIEGNNKRH